jgi:deoxyhypusine synthase
MKQRSLHDGAKDGLKALESLDLAKVGGFGDLVHAMSKTAFGGRQVGNALEIWREMAADPDVKVVMTLSGAMTVAKQGSIVCEMIDRGLVHAIVATGALMAHGLTESIGLTHFAVDPAATDLEMFKAGYNRVYDTLEMEENLNEVCRLAFSVLETAEPEDGVWSSARFSRALGARLEDLGQGPGILRSAYNKGVPVFVPAFTDSELGLDFSTWAMRRALKKKLEEAGPDAEFDPHEVFDAIPSFNPFLDLQEYARFIAGAKKLGIFTIGGGVPRNWAQQVAPYYDITADRLGISLPEPRFQYGIRICPEPVHWGGLSGCTYSEGVSWGKFIAPQEGGRYAEVFSDATVVWPLLMKALFESLDQPGQ